MASICPPAIILEQEVDVEVILRTCRTPVFCRHCIRNRNRLGFLRRYICLFVREDSFINHFAVLQQLPLDVISIDIREIILVIDVDLAVHELIFRGHHPDRLVLVFYFIELRLRVTVRGYDAVHTEITTVVGIAPVSAVAEELAIHLFIIKILMGIVLCVVVPILLLKLGHRLRVIQPQDHTVIFCANGRSLAVLCLEFLRRQRSVVNTRKRDLAVHGTIVLQIDTNAKIITIGMDIEAAIIGIHQSSVIVDLQSSTVIGTGDLVPIAYPVAREVKGSRIPICTVIDKEFHAGISTASGLQSNLRIALGDKHAIGCSRIRLYHHFKGKVCIRAGEHSVIDVVGRAGNHGISIVCFACKGSIVCVNCAGCTCHGCYRCIFTQLSDAALAGQGIEVNGTGLVNPVPNEAAEHIVRAADSIPILFQVTDRIAHRMGIFAHDIRHLAFASISLYCTDRRIHIAAHIGSTVLVQTFRMNRASQIAVLEEPHQARENIVTAVAVIAHLIADGPCDNRGLILQRLVRGIFTVE